MGKRVNMETKKTSLYKLHQDSNAKFVEFAGYQMPIQYPDGIVEEHKFTRTHSGIFDVSHMGQLFIYGKEDLVRDLEKIFPLDLKNLKWKQKKHRWTSYIKIVRQSSSNLLVIKCRYNIQKVL